MNALGKTDVGLRRHENQDTFAVETIGKSVAAVVCDGMGGAEGGQIASTLAVETFLKELRALLREDMSVEQLRELASFCVAQANTAVYERALEDDCRGMGTTLVSAVAGEKGTVVCNVGDSRAYLIRGGEITRITHDHSVVQTLVESGNITAEEARTHPNRNLITRALGTEEMTQCDAFEVAFQRGDKLLHRWTRRHGDGRGHLPRRLLGQEQRAESRRTHCARQGAGRAGQCDGRARRS